MSETPVQVLAQTYFLDIEKLPETLYPLNKQTIVIVPIDTHVQETVDDALGEKLIRIARIMNKQH
ncbi:hypothetical protein [Terribacillus aidingensis]|uniref:hypothetical protein n=1 Tax=Terribacillus aidingensis TaxID=586416 RepID=UPI00117DC98B|nr:hypothetical protein [Terribacillus aidingensis]